MTLQQAQTLALQRGVNPDGQLVILGLRSSLSTYGKYDDKIALLVPAVGGKPASYLEYLGNTLPSVDTRGTAVLQPGVYDYKIGLHGISHLHVDSKGNITPADQPIYQYLITHEKEGLDYPTPVLDEDRHVRLLPYPAFRQAGPVLVKRIGAPVALKDGWPDAPDWIDIHKGGYNLTSSLGCQTLYPDHWEVFRRVGFSTMVTLRQSIVKYVLVQL